MQTKRNTVYKVFLFIVFSSVAEQARYGGCVEVQGRI
jgi:hypothetical protein